MFAIRWTVEYHCSIHVHVPDDWTAHVGDEDTIATKSLQPNTSTLFTQRECARCVSKIVKSWNDSFLKLKESLTSTTGLTCMTNLNPQRPSRWNFPYDHISTISQTSLYDCDRANGLLKSEEAEEKSAMVSSATDHWFGFNPHSPQNDIHAQTQIRQSVTYKTAQPRPPKVYKFSHHKSLTFGTSISFEKKHCIESLHCIPRAVVGQLFLVGQATGTWPRNCLT